MNKISVAIATYNGEKYIFEQLESVLKNIKNDDEIIISDDGSTDNTLSIIASLQDPRIKIIPGPKQGIIKNFENAINHTTGDLIFLADQDDVWKENKVATVVSYFNEDPKLLLTVHDCNITDESLNITNESFFRFRNSKNGFLNNIIKNSFMGCCMTFRSELKSLIVPIPKEMMMHDQWIGLIALKKGKVTFIPEQLLLYRRHGSNSSDFNRNSVLKMITNRLLILKLLHQHKKNQRRTK